jgi:hypothetical protein
VPKILADKFTAIFLTAYPNLPLKRASKLSYVMRTKKPSKKLRSAFSFQTNLFESISSSKQIIGYHQITDGCHIE